MQRLEVSGAVRLIYKSLCVKRLMTIIRELYMYLTKIIFMLKRSVNLRTEVAQWLRCCAKTPESSWSLAPSVNYTTSCKHTLVLLKMDEIIARNVLCRLKLLIKIIIVIVASSWLFVLLYQSCTVTQHIRSVNVCKDKTYKLTRQRSRRNAVNKFDVILSANST